MFCKELYAKSKLLYNLGPVIIVGELFFLARVSRIICQLFCDVSWQKKEKAKLSASFSLYNSSWYTIIIYQMNYTGRNGDQAAKSETIV